MNRALFFGSLVSLCSNNQVSSVSEALLECEPAQWIGFLICAEMKPRGREREKERERERERERGREREREREREWERLAYRGFHNSHTKGR
ncbi:hypothetical protein FHG87_005915 [Trinorchestia longiramus]|nr:hypothetical protein FHG87_005915 [Trinorchestia longiramus]